MTESEYKPVDNTLAPGDWDSYIGQQKVKDLIRMQINAAMARYEQLDHCLIVGQSGMGKTSLANLIAGEHHLPWLPLMITPNFKINTLNKLMLDFSEQEAGIIFLDEIHNFSKSQQHYLFSVLEGGYISYDNGNKVFFPHPMTIVAATTEEQLLVKPLLGRFGAPYRLQPYSEIEMAQIVDRMAIKLGLNPTKEQCIALGRASAGSPRQAKALVKIARDIGTTDTHPILVASEITPDGLTVDHVAYLETLKKLGMSAGIDSISDHAGRAKEVMRDIEKLLVDREFIQISKSGRSLMQSGVIALKTARQMAEVSL